MKKLLFFVTIVIVFAFTNRDRVIKNTSVIITPESILSVEGTTNVNTFTCAFNVNQLKTPIPVSFHIEDDGMVFNKTVLVLDNSCFDCGNKGINKDFQKLLKTEIHPQIFLYLEKIVKTKNDACVQAFVDIEIAGIKKSYKIPVTVKNKESLIISGIANLNLSDFNLEAPKKVLGLIVVNDEIDIDFQLKIKEY